MLLPKGGLGGQWKAASSRMPPTRAIWVFLTRTRFLLCVAIMGVVLLFWRGVSTSASEMQRYVLVQGEHLSLSGLHNHADSLNCRFYCWGPSKPPMQMTPNEYADWNAHLQTPVIFNHHEPLVINESTISKVDLNPIRSTPKAAQNEERVLILTPLRDAATYLPKYFELLSELTYPHHLIDLAFLVGDSADDTLATLSKELERVQTKKESLYAPFRSALIVQKDFGIVTSQDVQERHSFKAQAPRRVNMARARNYLLYAALKPEHSWVYWRDSDIVDSPSKIIEDFVAHDKDIIVPSMFTRSL
jgi:hypothetical protein